MSESNRTQMRKALKDLAQVRVQAIILLMSRVVLFLTVIIMSILVRVLPLGREAKIHILQVKVDTIREKAVNAARSLDKILIHRERVDPILQIQEKVVIIRRLLGKGDTIHQVHQERAHIHLHHHHHRLQDREVMTQGPQDKTEGVKQNHFHHHLKAVKVHLKGPNPRDRVTKTLSRQIKYPRVIRTPLLVATTRNR